LSIFYSSIFYKVYQGKKQIMPVLTVPSRE
jgi:hypothetical protein